MPGRTSATSSALGGRTFEHDVRRGPQLGGIGRDGGTLARQASSLNEAASPAPDSTATLNPSLTNGHHLGHRTTRFRRGMFLVVPLMRWGVRASLVLASPDPCASGGMLVSCWLGL